MKLRELIEAYENNISKGKGIIFVNPSPKEMMTAADEKLYYDDKPSYKILRFIAHEKSNKLYIINGNYVHQHIFNKTNTKRREGLAGIAEFKSGRWVFTEADIMPINWEEEWNPKKYEWADKYISITPYLKEMIQVQKKKEEKFLKYFNNPKYKRK